MKREIKITILTIFLLADIVVSALLFNAGLKNYLIVTGALIPILAIWLITYINDTRSSEVLYKSTLRQIMKCYDSALVKSNNFPKLADKNIIKVATIDDLIDAQAEIRKPIYYKQEVGACSFILLDTDEACVYILKETEDKKTSLEIIIEELEKAKKENKDVDLGVLEDIEKTTIIMLENAKSYRISPIRDEEDSSSNDKKEEVLDDDELVEIL